MIDPVLVLLPFAAGIVGGAMNALAGGGTFATLPALIAIGLPANLANATSNVALMPGAATSAWAFRKELGPIGGIGWRTLAAITFVAGLIGSMLLVLTPARAFDVIIPWLLLFALVVMLFGTRASAWLHERVTIGKPTLVVVQVLVGIYGGYFGGGVGLITTALYGLLAHITPRQMYAPRLLMLGLANFAAALVFAGFGMIVWWACLPMLVGAVLGGWLGAKVGQRLTPAMVRWWTLIVTATTTAVFFWRAYV